ncbi:hypothetical protein VTK73DRAFT_7543 [Phialemonium thermophilum]|uniref:Uncharacterized protein n=1 Tax=Phialemonium thermophilum TaxID=223376 RepID=A0ABR3XSS1_9PEZI
MKRQHLLVFASLLSVSLAAPVSECAAVPTSSCTVITTTITTTFGPSECVAEPTAAAAVTSAEAAVATAAAAGGVNVQAFTGTLGGPPPPVVSSAGDRPFSVNGDTFVGLNAALGRSCDVQHNACANAANSGQLSGGVGACDQQNDECHQFNSLARHRLLRARRDVVEASRPPATVSVQKRALNLGSCSDPTILFEEGLDGRNTAAFIAANQDDFNHGSALNIAVIAGFICQRLDSSCKAGDDAKAACTSASAAAVATSQNQAAADVFNSIIGAGGAAVTGIQAASSTAEAVAAATTVAASLAAVQTGIVIQTITSCS